MAAYKVPFVEDAFRTVFGPFIANSSPTTIYVGIVDRIYYHFTPFVLLLIVTLLSANTYFSSPVQCWVPTQYPPGWQPFVESYCYAENTYFIPTDTGLIPGELPPRRERVIQYYQWVHVVLAWMAMFFYVPHFLWRILHRHCGIDLETVVKHAMQSANEPVQAQRKNKLNALAGYLSIGLGGHYRQRGISPHPSFSLPVVYLCVKVFSIVVVVVNFVVLNMFFVGPNAQWWTWRMLSDILLGHRWQESGHFPRIAWCDVEAHAVGNIHRHSFQCVLRSNMLNEKIFVTLYFWFLILGVLGVCSLAYWSFVIFGPRRHGDQLVLRYLRSQAPDAPGSADDRTIEAVRKFWKKGEMGRRDLIFVMRFIAAHVGEIVSIELAGTLYHNVLLAPGSLQATLAATPIGALQLNGAIPNGQAGGKKKKKGKGGGGEGEAFVDGGGEDCAVDLEGGD